MIQAYEKSNINFEKNGDMVLLPETCTMRAVLNGEWELNMVHDRDAAGRWKHIESEGIIAVPTFMGKKQLFRIDEYDKSDDEVTAKAYPVFFDSANDHFLLDVRPTNKNGQQALNDMLAGSKYTGESDIKTASTAYFIDRNFMDAINGSDQPTFIERWGGEILYDNFNIIINEKVGGDYGFEVRYGKNMEGINFTEDMSEVVTRIIPQAYNGYKMSGDTPWVDSKNIGKYAKKFIKKFLFDDVKMRDDAREEDEENGVIICNNQEDLDRALRKRCEEQFEAGVDIPKVTIEINMVDLSETSEYRNYKELERVGLGDVARWYHRDLDIKGETRVIEVEWDCVEDKAKRIVLGDCKQNYLNELSSTLQAVEKIIGPGNTVVAERVQGVLNAINTQLRYQKSIAQKQDVRAILFEDIDPESPTYGAMCLGTQGFQIADKRTQDGRDWDWTTAFTARGGYADVLIAGLLSDKTGKSFWNLDTGEMQLSGVFRQFGEKDNLSVEIRNNRVNFYDWTTKDEYVGSIGSAVSKDGERASLSLWADVGDRLVLGYMLSNNTIKRAFSIDSLAPNDPPYIENTVSGTIFGNNTNGGVKVKNGLITEWGLKTISGSINLTKPDGKTAKLTIGNGLIEGIEES